MFVENLEGDVDLIWEAGLLLLWCYLSHVYLYPIIFSSIVIHLCLI
jgi:hypothetical protein